MTTLFRRRFEESGISVRAGKSGHSLRRGLTSWAHSDCRDTKGVELIAQGAAGIGGNARGWTAWHWDCCCSLASPHCETGGRALPYVVVVGHDDRQLGFFSGRFPAEALPRALVEVADSEQSNEAACGPISGWRVSHNGPSEINVPPRSTRCVVSCPIVS